MKETDARIQSLDKLIVLLKEKKAKQKQVFQIFAKNIDGKTYTINDVDSSCTVREIKLKIEEKIGLPIEEQRLIYQGKQLEEEQEISHYDIEKGSTIHVVLSLKGGFGELLGEVAEYLGVENSFSVIAEALGITPAMLGAGLMLGGVASWSVLKLIDYLRNGNSEENDLDENSDNENGEEPVNKGGQVFVKSDQGETYTLNNIEEETTVEDLKAQIEEKIGLPVEQQKLMYSGKELTEEGNTMVDEGIKANVTLHIYLPLPKSNTVEDVQKLSENLLDDLRELEGKFDFLEEEAQKPFLDILRVLMESKDLEVVNQLYDKLIVMHGKLIKDYEQLIRGKEEECRGLESSLEEVIQKMNLLNLSEFLEEKEQIDISSIEEKIPLITKRDLSSGKIKDYQQLFEKAEEEIARLEEIIRDRQKKYDDEIESLIEEQANLARIQSGSFLKEENFEEIKRWDSEIDQVKDQTATLDVLTRINALLEEAPRLIKVLQTKKSANEQEWDGIKREAEALLRELEEVNENEFLKNEVEVTLFGEKLTAKYRALEELTYTREHCTMYRDFIKDVKLQIDNSTEKRALKEKAWAQMAEESSKLRALAGELKGTSVQIEAEDKESVNQKIAKSAELNEMEDRIILIEGLIEKYNGKLNDLKVPILDEIEKRLDTLKAKITTYQRAAIEEKAAASEDLSLVRFKDCVDRNALYNISESYEILVSRRDELGEVINTIDGKITEIAQDIEENQEVQTLAEWVLNKILYKGAGVSEKTICSTTEGEEYLEKLVNGQLNDRHGGGTIVLNKPLHQHLNDGDSGMSFYYKKEENGTITPIVYDYAKDRSGNKYNWKNGKQSSGPSNSSNK